MVSESFSSSGNFILSKFFTCNDKYPTIEAKICSVGLVNGGSWVGGGGGGGGE